MSKPPTRPLIDRALGAVGLSRRSMLETPPAWMLNAFGGAPTASGARVDGFSALGIPAAYACINLFGSLVGSLPARVVMRTEMGHEDLDKHPVSLLLLRRPNERQTPFEFRRLLQVRVGGSGMGFARIYRDERNTPISLVPVCTSDVEILAFPRGGVRYRLKASSCESGILAAEFAGEDTGKLLTRADLLHVNALSSDGFTGISPITMLRENIGIAISQRDSLSAFLKNGARFPGILSAEGLTEAQMKDFRIQWELVQSGVINTGKMPVLNGAFKYLDKSAGMSMADQEFLASRSFENNEICSVFGVPPILIGATDKVSSWGSGIEQINQGFLTYGLNPWLVNWEQSLALSLLTSEEIASGHEIRFDRSALMQASLATRAAFYQQMRLIGAMSVNDVRHEIGFNAVTPEIGDDLRLPFNNQGGVTAATEPAQQA